MLFYCHVEMQIFQCELLPIICNCDLAMSRNRLSCDKLLTLGNSLSCFIPKIHLLTPLGFFAYMAQVYKDKMRQETFFIYQKGSGFL